HLDAWRAVNEFSQPHSRAAVEPGKFDLRLQRTQGGIVHWIRTDHVGIGQEQWPVSPGRAEVRPRHKETCASGVAGCSIADAANGRAASIKSFDPLQLDHRFGAVNCLKTLSIRNLAGLQWLH